MITQLTGKKVGRRFLEMSPQQHSWHGQPLARKSSSGYMIILTLIIVFALTSIGLSIMNVVSSKYSVSVKTALTENAVSTAEAGISDSLEKLRNDPSFTGYDASHARGFYDRGPGGKAIYTSTITPPTAENTQTITSTGYVYRTATDPITSPASSKTVRLTVQKSRLPVQGSVLAGPAGLRLGSNASIPAAAGGVYVQGKIGGAGSNGAGSALGTPGSTMPINVANAACGSVSGPGADWPQTCGPGSPSVNLAAGAKVYGKVCATNQVSTTGITTLKSGCSTFVQQPPLFDKQAFVTRLKVPSGKILASTINQRCLQGPPFDDAQQNRTIVIPPNTWINGDLYIGHTGSYGFGPNMFSYPTDGLGSCRVLFAGDTYIDGGLTVTYRGSLGIANSATTSPTIVVNKQVVLNAAGAWSPFDGFQPNSSGVHATLISFYSASNPGCSVREDTPSPSIPTCLTRAQVQSDANRTDDNMGGWSISCGWFGVPPSNWGDYCDSQSGGHNVIDFSGLNYYSYYMPVNIPSSMKIGAISAPKIAVDTAYPGYPSQLTITSTDSSPFGMIATAVAYKVLDYQQIY